MASVVALFALLVIVAIHTLLVAVVTRFFRVQMSTRVGALLYTGILTPLVLLISTFVFTGALGIGIPLGGTGTALFVTIGIPMGLGVAIDYIWMPPPEDVTLPETTK